MRNKTMKDKVKILYFMDGIGNGGGIQEMVIKWMQNIDREKFQIDILSYNRVNKDNFRERVAALGGKVFIIESFQNPKTFIKSIWQTKDFFHKNKYDILHAHSSSKAFFVMKYAKKYGVETRILHSHCASFVVNGAIPLMVAKALKKPTVNLATDYFACSVAAGNFLFGKEASDRIYYAHNGIDTSLFKPNHNTREKVREELGIKDKYVIGHIGRFMPQKNHAFLIDIFKEVCSMETSSVLVLVGDGSLKESIEEKVKKLGISDKVIFLGKRNDVNEIVQAFDLLLMPSLFEGLPVTAVEAQACGVPCLFSSSISSDAAIIPNCAFLDLNESAEFWAKKSIGFRNNEREIDPHKYIKERGYDIKVETDKLSHYYLSKVNGGTL